VAAGTSLVTGHSVRFSSMLTPDGRLARALLIPLAENYGPESMCSDPVNGFYQGLVLLANCLT
jgi:hypothetical protein